MRYLFGLVCVCAVGLVPLVGCGDDTGDGGTGGIAGTGGAGGTVIEAIKEMMVGRWWLDWDQAGSPNTVDGVALPTFTADGWANYDVRFPNIAGVTDWCRRYADWSLFDVVSETEFGYELSYTHTSCNRQVGWVEEFKVVLDETNPPKGEVTRLASPILAIGSQWTLPIERCTTDIDATEACTFDTGLGAPSQNPPTM